MIKKIFNRKVSITSIFVIDTISLALQFWLAQKQKYKKLLSYRVTYVIFSIICPRALLWKTV